MSLLAFGRLRGTSVCSFIKLNDKISCIIRFLGKLSETDVEFVTQGLGKKNHLRVMLDAVVMIICDHAQDRKGTMSV